MYSTQLGSHTANAASSLTGGAGKTLTGVTAAQTIKKSVVCLATNAVSVLQVRCPVFPWTLIVFPSLTSISCCTFSLTQWKYQFQLWTSIPEDRVSPSTSNCCLCLSLVLSHANDNFTGYADCCFYVRQERPYSSGSMRFDNNLHHDFVYGKTCPRVASYHEYYHWKRMGIATGKLINRGTARYKRQS